MMILTIHGEAIENLEIISEHGGVRYMKVNKDRGHR